MIKIKATHYCSRCKRPRPLGGDIGSIDLRCPQAGSCNWVQAEKWAPEFMITAKVYGHPISFWCAMCCKPKTSKRTHEVTDTIAPQQGRDPEMICNGCYGKIYAEYYS